ncbi:hypothetical protein B7494_g2428 [Chlorociboria aeruginascens]|nr:hypothetical protein B7494_g2428 [Chlorociboria aeruginascens]
MASSTSFTSTSPIVNFGRGGYNGPASSEDDDSHSIIPRSSMDFGRKACNNKRGDDDDEEDGRGGYN